MAKNTPRQAPGPTLDPLPDQTLRRVAEDNVAARPTSRNRAAGTVRVRATVKCFYGDIRRRVGDVFDLVPRSGLFTEQVLDKDGEPKTDKSTGANVTQEVEKTLTAEDQFNPSCMEKVDLSTPPRFGSGQEEIQQQHDAILAARVTGRGVDQFDAPTGDSDPLGDD